MDENHFDVAIVRPTSYSVRVPVDDSPGEFFAGGKPGPTDDAQKLLYRPLANHTREFRLLTILPAENHEDELECLLGQANLDALTDVATQLEYETISYCWGGPKREAQIIVNRLQVLIPISASAALRRMRLEHQIRVVWLDVVCINQLDISERGQQVSMMDVIYRNGLRNLIYLGEDNIDLAIGSLKAIMDEALTKKDAFSHLRNELGTWQYASTGIVVKYDIPALIQFFSIPWFRLWVVQECALARQNICFCGSSELDLLDITRSAAWLVYNYYFVDPDLRLKCSYAADMNDLVDPIYGYHRSKSGHPASLLYLLDLAQQRLSSEPVDKIYGILGLATTEEGQSRLSIKPDYSKQTSDIFREAAWCLVRDGGDLQVLDYVRHQLAADGTLSANDFPSWVPRWHEPKNLDEHPNFMALSFDACSSRRVELMNSDSANPDILMVAGIEVDRVVQTTGRIQSPDEANRAQCLSNVVGQVQQMVSKSVAANSGTLDLSVATSLVAGVDAHFKPVGPEILHSYNAFRSSIERGILPSMISEIGTGSDNANDVDVLASHFGEAMWNACMNRSFCVTELGHFGLGPHFMKPDDVVAILYGLQYPAILRRYHVDGSDGREPEYTFLGTAYVHGLMYGEAVKEHDEQGRKRNVFRIR